ncbi:MAG TPA: N-acetylmuramoyl-L-alanine amidase [Rheinheimera sp.]|uniref:N-acetylmuramoyl-L-alanine amidase n=1 Tax=Rheinheimera sp. TaxID=1869214 RepID=UPI000EC6DBDC|nr:N-acetylmuramoyl-L-alanine amidase [Rheinheimera sp.]HCU65218.1 N-acetylmuramoyl-L-alanine amidase [Rheinheimera sp.]
MLRFLWCCFLGVMFAPALAAEKIESVRIWPSPDSTRVVFDVSGKAQYRLLSQNRQTVELEIANILSPSLGKMSGESELVKDIKVKKLPGNRGILLQVELTRAAREKAFTLPPSDRYGHRLVLDLADVQAEQAAATPPPPRSQRAGGRDIVIAIDAGHGGHDPGAVGPKGTYEKHVTMAVSEKLQALINKEPGFKAVLTRTSDYYIYPSKRPDLARNKQADLLVSVHADAVTNRKAHGASVWVLSLRRATTEVGRMLEQTEQHSELLGGVAEVIKDSANERYLAQTVLDLSMNHSMTTGFEVARRVLAEMGRVTHLHKKEPQAASLGVLKAPDIPSILVETGYISNPTEEQKLKSASHQQKLANAIFRALKQHFTDTPPADSWLAQRQGAAPVNRTTAQNTPARTATTTNPGSSANTARQQPASQQRPAPVIAGPRVATSAASGPAVHTVKRGETLSGLAKQYGLPMSVLRNHNKLKSDNIQVGQVLRIPN